MSFLKKIWKNIYFRNIVFALLTVFILVIASNILLDVFTRHGKSQPVPNFKGMNLDSAYILAKAHNLRIEIVDSIYQPGFPKGAVFDQNPKEKDQVKKNRKIFITVNSMSPKKEPIPDVVGFSLRQAKAELRSKGFIIGSLSYVSDIATNNVLEQKYKGKIIEPGVLLPTGTQIDLQLGLDSTALRIPIPNVIGLNVENARDLITDNSLNYKLIFDRSVKSFSDSINSRVYRQDPTGNRNAVSRYGATINVYLKVEKHR